MPEQVWAPFDKDQRASLNEFQFNNEGYFHEYTCPSNNEYDWHPQTILVATESELQCPIILCDYFQLWAWDFTSNWKWLSMIEDELHLPKG